MITDSDGRTTAGPASAVTPEAGPLQPGRPRIAVVLGAPRSGTSWLQHLLATHPQVATTPELHLFSGYVLPLLRAWDRQVAEVATAVAALGQGSVPADRLVGLPTCLTAAEMDEAVRSLYRPIVHRVVVGCPGTEVVVEKTPSNSLVVPYIERVAPGALYIHIVRDPRQVVTSLVDVARSWGGAWAPRSAAVAALLWRAYVLGAFEARRFGDRYIQVSYEALRADPYPVLVAVLGAMGLAVDDAARLQIEAAIDDRDVSTDRAERATLTPDVLAGLGDRPIVEPEGFGTGGPRGRRLGPGQEWIVEALTADLMVELGYPRRRALGGPADTLPATVLGAIGHRLPPEVKRQIALRLRGYGWRNALSRATGSRRTSDRRTGAGDRT